MAVVTVIEAIRDAMREEMERDVSVFVMGEDVGRRGGVFLATKDFLDEFGAGGGGGHPPPPPAENRPTGRGARNRPPGPRELNK
ncbi:MAG: hypothetical protein F4Y25_12165, partial [Chloroflexi bacterium]|nr:hypothetical protein [Chloroflexota bacterium]